MKNIILTSLTIIALTGCGGGGGSTPTGGNTGGGDSNGTVTPPVTNAVYDAQLPNVPLFPNTTDSTEPFYSAQWYLEYNKEYYDAQAIDANASINGHVALRKYDGSGVKIAVLDGGYDLSHDELSGIDIIGRFNVVPATEDRTDIASRPGQNDPTGGHGTSVLGLIATEENGIGLRGIAPNASYYLAAQYDTSNASDLEDALKDMNTSGVGVFSTSYDPFTYFAVNSTSVLLKDLALHGNNNKGIVFVFAAGNDNASVDYYLDVAEYALVIGATNKTNTKASYSNFGKLIDIVAPGGEWDIVSIDRSGTEGRSSTDYAQFAGTSAATPIVAGAIALARQARPDLNATVIMDLVRITADKVGSEPYNECGTLGCRNDIYGYGKLNLDKFIEAVENF